MNIRISKPPEERSCAAFKKVRSEMNVGNEEFARSVLALPVFGDKLRLVTNVIVTSWYNCAVFEDAMQDATISVFRYLSDTRGRDFVGETDDELGAWLYCLIRQHVRWALGNIGRSNRRRQHHEQAASRPLMLCADVSAHNDRVASLVDAVAKLPVELRRIVAAILLGDDVATITGRVGISRRTFYRLRKEAYDLLRDMLTDDDDDSSSLVPV